MFPALILIFASIAYRLAYAFSGAHADWANFSPLAAIVFCSAAFFTRKAALLIPLAAILVSDILLNAHYHASLFDTGIPSRYFSFCLIALLGFFVQSKQNHKLIYLFSASVIGSLIFYVLTNTDAWITLPGYPKTLSGWIQALTVGEPAYPATYLFLRNTVLSDLLFTGLFVATQSLFVKTNITLPAKARLSH